ncbi:diacylglycerol/polyprenol kinase family protein [Saccharicrinis fermentans]|uniref:Cytidylyltransferase family protein n=1 Tax=Saccharicrinis fermentans DSM 9555 = JCM 21142 TaxID=869213 RepID=W7YPU3_9BACT|nr:phosphatidate cytidylyltransferase [Saccharicrinis fermentans]GAF04474.1 cytidylyltransferase family protein [Saccharicrinis fermentans DSM 9555 = JCM 21142]
MGNIMVMSAIYFVGIALLLIANELGYRKYSIKGEVTRKIAHFLSIIATIPLPYLFSSHWYILGLAIIFFAALYITQFSKQLNSIHDIERKSIGSYLLPLSIYVIFLIASLLDNKFVYILPMLILAVCDPMAAIVGMSVKKNNRKIRIFSRQFDKTWFGSGAFFLMSFIIGLVALYYVRDVFDFKTIYLALSVALAGTTGEFLSWRGSDNLSIPLFIVIVLVVLL